MTAGSVLFLIGLLLSLPSRAAGYDAKDDWENLEFAPIEVERTHPHSETLPNGIRLFTLQDDRLPLVDISVLVKTGSIYEPAELAGVAGMTGRVLRTGGTVSRSWEEVDETVDAMAARFRTWIATEAGGAYMNVHSRNLGEALDILADVLRNPAFDDEKIDVVREQMREEIRRQNDDPDRIAFREGMKRLYGPEHPQARRPTFETLDRIGRSDLIEFHHHYFVPNNVWIGVAGNTSPEAARAAVERAFGSWMRRDVTFAAPPQPGASREPEIVHVQKELQQSTIVMGHLCIREDDPDRYKLRMANLLLGGRSFPSRLWDRIRRSEGLAYSTRNFLRLAFHFDGSFGVLARTKGESTGRVMQMLMEEIRRIHDEPVSEEELGLARSALLNQEVFNYEDPETVVLRMLRLDLFGLPPDHYEKAFDEYQAITGEELHSAVRRHLHPDKLKIVVVGDERTFDFPLSDFGYDVKTIELD